MKNLLYATFSFVLFSGLLFSQVSEGGSPVSFGLSNQSAFDTEIIELQKPNITQLSIEDEVNDQLGRTFRVGQLIQTNLSPMNSGTWSTLDDGSKIWQLVAFQIHP